MITYQIWCNLKDGSQDREFCRSVDRYLGRLRQMGLIEGFRVTRRMLGFGPPSLGEFHIAIEVRDLAQLDRTFGQVATRSGEIESLHHAVYSAVTDLSFAAYRDFPGTERGPRDG